MSYIWDSLGKGAGSALGVAAAALLAMVTFLPKLRNGMKTDQLDGDVLTRLTNMEKHANAQDRRMVHQDRKIHRYAVRLTRLVVVVIRLEGLLVANSVVIPPDLVEEIYKLKDDEESDSHLNAEEQTP